MRKHWLALNCSRNARISCCAWFSRSSSSTLAAGGRTALSRQELLLAVELVIFSHSTVIPNIVASVGIAKPKPMLGIQAVQELDSKVEDLASLPSSPADSFGTRFFTSLKTRLTAWFADAANGIRFGRVNTEKLCVGTTCLTEDQFKSLVIRAGNDNDAAVVEQLRQEIRTLKKAR